MSRFKTILAPVDFSDMSREAAEHAAMLARKFDAKLLMAYVRPPADLYGPAAAAAEGLTQRDLEEIQLVEAQLRGWTESIWPQGNTEQVLASGDAARQLCAIVENKRADLIVMATHGHGGFRRFLTGSLTQKLLHDLACPILTGVHRERPVTFPDKLYERIACAVGLQESVHSENVLRWAADFAGQVGAKLTVLHAAPPLSYPMFPGGPSAMNVFPEETRASVVLQRQKLLGDLLGQLGIDAEINVAAEETVSYIERAVKETNSDLLIVGRSIRHGVFGGPHGDAYNIMRHSPAPVLSV